MSSKTGNRHIPPPQPGGKKGKGTVSPSPAPETAVRPFDDRFHRMFCNAMIPVLGIMSVLSLFALLTGEPRDDLSGWIDLVYHSVTIGCCIVAFPGMRGKRLRGWQAAMTLIALNACYAVYLAVIAVMAANLLQVVLSLATALCFVLLFFYYKKRKHLFPH